MTIIVWDGKTLAADKRATSSGFIGGIVTKIHRWDGGLCAFAGNFALGHAMVEWLRSGADVAKFPAAQRTDDWVSFLVVHADGRVVRYEKEPVALPFENLPQVMGSGRDYALAALYLGCDARRAVEVACAMDESCGNGIDTLQLAG